jgi:hypothetical protein
MFNKLKEYFGSKTIYEIRRETELDPSKYIGCWMKVEEVRFNLEDLAEKIGFSGDLGEKKNNTITFKVIKKNKISFS